MLPTRALLVLALSLTSCVTMRVYKLPLSTAEGQAMVPALIAASQEQGLESFHGPNGAVTNLEDGVMLSWQNSAGDDEFILVMSLPDKIPDAEAQARFEVAKARADQLWSLAVASRSMLMPPPAVVVQPAPLVAQPAPEAAHVETTTISIGGGVMPGVTVTVDERSSSQGAGTSSATCCINGAGYACPSAAAVDRCSGAYMRCMSACDFSCQSACARDAPLDPSACRREPALDSSCRR